MRRIHAAKKSNTDINEMITQEEKENTESHREITEHRVIEKSRRETYPSQSRFLHGPALCVVNGHKLFRNDGSALIEKTTRNVGFVAQGSMFRHLAQCNCGSTWTQNVETLHLDSMYVAWNYVVDCGGLVAGWARGFDLERASNACVAVEVTTCRSRSVAC
jgi:hypothetical protein